MEILSNSSGWKELYRMAAIAALVSGLVILLGLVLYFF